MLSRANGNVWMDDTEDPDSASWAKTNNNNNSSNKEEMVSLSSFKSMLEMEDEWYNINLANNSLQSHTDMGGLTFSSSLPDPESLLLNPVDSSSSCSPSSSVFTNFDPSQFFKMALQTQTS